MKPCLSRNLKDKIRISQQKRKKEQTISRGCPELALGTHGRTRGWALIIEEECFAKQYPSPIIILCTGKGENQLWPAWGGWGQGLRSTVPIFHLHLNTEC